MSVDQVATAEPQRRSSVFVRFTDAVSFGMGTPTNIGFWLLAVAAWFALALIMPTKFSQDPGFWNVFTSTSWNFPLNTVTTLAELYIGFLVGAAANRSERHLFELLERMRHVMDEEDGELTALTRDTAEHKQILTELNDFANRTLTELAEINNNLNSPALKSLLTKEQARLDASEELQRG